MSSNIPSADKKFICRDCNSKFKTELALQAHQTAKAHTAAINSNSSLEDENNAKAEVSDAVEISSKQQQLAQSLFASSTSTQNDIRRASVTITVPKQLSYTEQHKPLSRSSNKSFEQHDKNNKGHAKIFDHHISLLLSQGEYIDPDRIYSVLDTKIPGLRYFPRFQTIQWLHKDICSAIEAYLFSNIIRVYSDLEEFVVNAMSRRHKDRKFTHFTDIGMGFLYRHHRVVDYFGVISDPSTLPQLSINDIMKCLFLFYQRNRNLRSLYALGPIGANFQFNTFLREQLGRESSSDGKVTGVCVSYLDIARKIGRSHKDAEARAIRLVEQEQVKALKDKVSSSISSLKSMRCEDSSIDSIRKTLLVDSIDIFNIRKALKDIFEAVFDSSFMNLAMVFTCEIAPVKSIVRSVDDISPLEIDSEEKLSALFFDSESRGPLQLAYKYEKFQRLSEWELAGLLTAVWFMLTQEVIRSAEEIPPGYLTSSEFKEDLKTTLIRHIGTDIPLECIDALAAFMTSSLTQSTELKIDTDPIDGHKSVRHDVSKDIKARKELISSRMSFKSRSDTGATESETDTSKSKPKRTNLRVVTLSVYTALTTAAVLFYRFMKIEQKPSSATVISNAIQNLSNSFSDGMRGAGKEVHTAEALSMTILSSLYSLQDSIQTHAQVAVFECLNHGSFLGYLSQREGTILASLINGYVSNLRAEQYSAQDFGGNANGIEEIPDDLATHICEVLSDLLVLKSSNESSDMDILRTLVYLEATVKDAASIDSFDTRFGQSFLRILQDLVALSEDDLASRQTRQSNGSYTIKEHMSMLLSQFQSEGLPAMSFGQMKDDGGAADAVGETLSPSYNRRLSNEVIRAFIQQYQCAQMSDDKTSLQVITNESVSDLAEQLNVHEKRVHVVYDQMKSESCSGSSAKPSAQSDKPVILHFNLPPSEDRHRHWMSLNTNSVPPVELKAMAFRMISSLPLGSSFRSHLMWEELFEYALAAEEFGGRRSPVSVLDFILSEQQELLRFYPSIRFLAIDMVLDDCIALTAVCPDIDDMTRAVLQDDYCTIGSWCLSARHGIFDSQMFQESILNRYFLQVFESKGDDGFANVMDVLVHIVFSVPSPLQPDVLRMLLTVAELVTRLKFDTLQAHVVEHVLKSEDKGLLQSLVRLCARAANFPMLQSLLPSIIQRGLLSNTNEACTKRKGDTSFAPTSLDLDVQNPDGENVISAVDDTDRKEYVEIDPSVSAETAYKTANVQEVWGPKTFVEQLLETEFYVTRNTPAEKKLQCALERVAGELYSSDVHFVMELIQNADDNTYPVGIEPSLKIVVYGHALVICNNELGFSESNIRAICNVGGSTKVGHSGYIGQKGIGFKSVFSISHCPEIHSNGFHIQFDRRNMIEPIWIDESGDVKWPNHRQFDGNYATIIRLNLDNKALKNFAKLNENLEEAFDDKLLLFLHKLRKMILEDRCKNRSIAHCRTFLSDCWTKISASYENHLIHRDASVDNYWFITRNRISPTVRRNNDLVESSEVAVAFQFVVTRSRTVDGQANTNASVPKKPTGKSRGVAGSDDCDSLDDDCDDDDGGEGDDVVSREMQIHELRLMSDTVLPVYAYLPTKTTVFKFIIQGDFLLSSSRESLQEGDLQGGHQWNQHLIDQISDLFVDTFHEMMNVYWNKTLHEANDCPHFQQLDKAYDVQLAMKDLLALLPRLSNSPSPMYTRVIHKIYNSLKNVPFLRSRDGKAVLCREALTTHHLLFSPTDYISETLLHLCSGKLFLDDNIVLDDELAQLLGVAKFDEELVVQCMEKTDLWQDQLLLTNDDNDEKYKHSVLAGFLLLLSKFSGVTMTSTYTKKFDFSSKGPDLVPSQVALRVSAAPFLPSTSLKGSFMSSNANRLRNLTVWPTIQGTTVSLATDVLLMSSSTMSFSHMQQNCVNVFKSRIPLLDEGLFHSADSIQHNGGSVVRELLKRYMKPSVLTKSSTGGLEELTSDIIVKRVIIPSYEDGAVVLDRDTAAAYVAFLFLSENLRSSGTSEVLRALNKTGVLLPVMTAKDNKGMGWAFSRVQKLKKGSSQEPSSAVDAETHLGIEIRDTAANEFFNLPVSTALKQLGYAIVDPLCAAFAFGDSRTIASYLDPNTVYQKPLTEFFSRQYDDQAWRIFLTKIGAVNFYGLYNAVRGDCQPVFEAPVLIRMISHLTRLGQRVRTYDSSRSVRVGDELDPTHDDDVHNNDGKVDDSDADDAIGRVDSTMQSSVSMPLFLRYPEDGIKLVTKDVYNAVIGIVQLIEREVKRTSDALNRDIFPAFLDDLNKMAWFPAYVHGQYWDRSGFAPYILTSPRNVFSYLKSQSRYVEELLGPQCMYVPTKLDWVVDSPLANYFHFIRFQTTHTGVCLDSTVLLPMFEWMLSAQKKVSSSIAFMSNMYQQLLAIAEGPDITQRNRIVELLQGPFLWIPDTFPGENINEMLLGEFYPLDRIVKTDPSEKFLFLNSPVKVLSGYYGFPECNHVMDHMFARSFYCHACQVVEGMFGVRGGAISNCECKSFGFGKFAPYGTVKKSPAVEDVVRLLLHYRNQLTSESSMVLLTEEQQRDNICRSMKEILVLLSQNIWKCFHIPLSLHPYSPAALTTLKSALVADDLIPTLTGQFTRLVLHELDSESESEKLIIAIDDNHIWSILGAELTEKLEKVIWIDASLDSSNVDSTSAVLDSDSMTYSMDVLEEDVNNLLSQPRAAFEQLTTRISPMTFYAPKNMHCLFRFLQVPCLSQFVKIEWMLDNAKDCDKAKFGVMMNSLLMISQTFFFNKRPEVIPSLSRTEKFQQLLNVKVSSCSDLKRILRLNINNNSLEKEDIRLYYFDHIANAYYINPDISTPQLKSYCTSTLLSLFRKEVSRLALKQDYELMEDLQRCLQSMSQVDDEGIRGAFQVQGFACLPGDMEVWEMRSDMGVDVDTKDITIDASINEETQGIAIAGYENVLALAEARKSKPKPTGKTFVNPELEAFKALQTQQIETVTQSLSTGVEVAGSNISSATNAMAALEGIRSEDFSHAMPSDRGWGNSESFLANSSASGSGRGMGYHGGDGEYVGSRARDESYTRDHSQVNSLNPASGDNRSDQCSLDDFERIVYTHRHDQGGDFDGDGDGNRSGTGLFHPSLRGMDSSNVNDCFQLELSPDELGSLLNSHEVGELESIMSSASVIGDADRMAMFASSPLSGRVGELVAVEYLRRSLGARLGEGQVLWLNKDREAGLPFDMVLTVDGNEKLCEVKTRVMPYSSSDSIPSSLEWLMSPNEIHTAVERRDAYFLCCVCLFVDPVTGKIRGQRGMCVGLSCGLVSAVASKQASLLVQIRTSD